MLIAKNHGARLPIEMWGGLECTFNRVGDRYVDQCVLNGHDRRIISDLQSFGTLGLPRLRYPVLWDKVAPQSLANPNWESTDRALSELIELDIKPIAGLLHHGSGPRSTSLLDPEFPEKLAAFASLVASRYPHIDAYTPVNEPLTTARFSCLYGYWYPHKTDDASFIRALYNELRGTVLAMRSVRMFHPSAKLVQTEDLGYAKGTPELQYQVDFENKRRWLTFDFLCGMVDESHELFGYLNTRGGLTKKEILWFQENKLPPDVIGINHYPLSNRFLDHRIDLYPRHLHGGNGRDVYADVGSVDCGQVVPPAPSDIFRQVWERYRRPFAVTEAHISGPRETQMRWLNEIWTAAEKVHAEGADLRAVTAWSLLGSYGWSSLCTCEPGSETYESGVFDSRMPNPRPTALAKMVSALAKGGGSAAIAHPLLERGGYWTEPSRILFAPPEIPFLSPAVGRPRPARPLLIAGAAGALGRAFVRVCQARGIDFIAVDRAQMDIGSPESVGSNFDAIHPWAVVNAAGYSRIEQAERDPGACFRENALGAEVLARACAQRNIPFLTFSTDLVFGGDQREPYSENSQVAPLNVYGHSKVEAERLVTQACEQALIVRTSSLFSPWEQSGFLTSTLRALRNGQSVRAIEDIWASPTYAPDLVNSALDLLIDGERGLVHLTNEGAITWGDWARLAADLVNADRSLVVGCRGDDFPHSARRPAYSALRSGRLGAHMPTFQSAFETYLQETTREGLI